MDDLRRFVGGFENVSLRWRIGDIGEDDRLERNARVSGDRFGLDWIWDLVECSAGAREGLTGKRRCRVRDPAAITVSAYDSRG